MKRLTTQDLENRVFTLINPDGETLEKLAGKQSTIFCISIVVTTIIVTCLGILFLVPPVGILTKLILATINTIAILLLFYYFCRLRFGKKNLETLRHWRRAKGRIISQCYSDFVISCQLVDDGSPMTPAKFLESRHLLNLRGCYSEILAARALANQARDNHRAELRLHQAQVAVRGFRKF